MKCLVIALLVLSTLAIEHDELVDFMKGYLNGMHVKESPDKLLNCLDDTLGPVWEATVMAIKMINWNDIMQALTGVVSFLQPCLVGLGQLVPCSDGEIQDLLQKIEEMVKDQEKFRKRLMALLPTLITIIKQFLVEWDGQQYNKAGKSAGNFMDTLFFK